MILFDRHIHADEVPQTLADFDAVCRLRERMALPRKLIECQPRFQSIVITAR